ncbi:unnamed protein product, partial [Closterium sp. NIES-54]
MAPSILDPDDATSVVPDTLDDWYDGVTPASTTNDLGRGAAPNDYAVLRRRLTMRQQSMGWQSTRQQSSRRQQSFTSSRSFMAQPSLDPSLNNPPASSSRTAPNLSGRCSSEKTSSFVSAIPSFASSTSGGAPKLYQAGSIKEAAESEEEEAEGEEPARGEGSTAGGGGEDGWEGGTGETDGQDGREGTAPGGAREGGNEAGSGQRVKRGKLGRVSFAAATWKLGVDGTMEEVNNEDAADDSDMNAIYGEGQSGVAGLGADTWHSAAAGIFATASSAISSASSAFPSDSDAEEPSSGPSSSAFYNELFGIGEAPLINLIRRYHDALTAHGLAEEAQEIAASAAARLVSIKSMGPRGRSAAEEEEEGEGEDGEEGEGRGGGGVGGGWGPGRMENEEEGEEEGARSEVMVREGLQKYLIAMQPNLL